MRGPTCTRRCARSAFSARSSIALAIALTATVLWAQPADADLSDRARASELLAKGDDAGAAAAFEQAAQSSDDPNRQADALFSAARLYEERLAQPERAVALYQRITDEHGDSRVALAASRRLRELSSHLGGADAARALGAWKKLLHDYAEIGADEAATRARRLIEEHPGWSGRSQVWRWLADQERTQGQLEAAARDYRLALESAETTDDQFEAAVLLAEVALLTGELSAARTLLRRISTEGDPGRQRVLADLRERLDSRWRRQRLSRWAYLVAALCALALFGSLRMSAGSVKRALRALAHPPSEALFALPIVAVLIVMALASHKDIGPAVILIGTTGIAFSWLSGCALDLGDRSTTRVLAHVAIVALGVISTVFLAIERGHLIEQIAETVRFGPGG